MGVTLPACPAPRRRRSHFARAKRKGPAPFALSRTPFAERNSVVEAQGSRTPGPERYNRRFLRAYPAVWFRKARAAGRRAPSCAIPEGVSSRPPGGGTGRQPALV